ncbi:hypothetical protein [Pandoraea soli]|uniref:hypothetical protein n=1 Tax=Pandoraea soli TaxID=2508293 RepID=UPI00124024E3|nr:hypothetical protein [Pandoraea soli]
MQGRGVSVSPFPITLYVKTWDTKTTLENRKRLLAACFESSVSTGALLPPKSLSGICFSVDNLKCHFHKILEDIAKPLIAAVRHGFCGAANIHKQL